MILGTPEGCQLLAGGAGRSPAPPDRGRPNPWVRTTAGCQRLRPLRGRAELDGARGPGVAGLRPLPPANGCDPFGVEHHRAPDGAPLAKRIIGVLTDLRSPRLQNSWPCQSA